MKLKKTAITLLVTAVMVGATPFNAFASHGHRYSSSETAISYAVCPLEDCTQAGIHDHDGATYHAHHTTDGHTYHPQDHTSDSGHNSAYGHHYSKDSE